VLLDEKCFGAVAVWLAGAHSCDSLLGAAAAAALARKCSSGLP
jgi:hypothetical protein